jgi:hypothetical protein
MLNGQPTSEWGASALQRHTHAQFKAKNPTAHVSAGPLAQTWALPSGSAWLPAQESCERRDQQRAGSSGAFKTGRALGCSSSCVRFLCGRTLPTLSARWRWLREFCVLPIYMYFNKSAKSSFNQHETRNMVARKWYMSPGVGRNAFVDRPDAPDARRDGGGPLLRCG